MGKNKKKVAKKKCPIWKCPICGNPIPFYLIRSRNTRYISCDFCHKSYEKANIVKEVGYDND